MTDSLKLRASKYSHAQKADMVDFMELNPQLRSGKITKEFTAKISEELWAELSDLLNSLQGSQKSIHKWRKTWLDLKAIAKEKSATISKQTNGTGGGKAPAIALSELESRVCSLIGVTTINGDLQITESVANMNWEPTSRNPSTVESVNNSILLENDVDDFSEDTPRRSNRQSPTTIVASLPVSDITNKSSSRQKQRSLAKSSSTTNSQYGESQQQPSTSVSAPPFVGQSSSGQVAHQHSAANSSSTSNSQAGNSHQRPSTSVSASQIVGQSSNGQFSNPSINYLANILSRNRDQQNYSASSNSQSSLVGSVTRRRLSLIRLSISQLRSPSSQRTQRRQSPSPIRSHRSRAAQRRLLELTPDSLHRPTRVNTNQPNRPNRRIATQRFENTINATDKLVEAIQRKTELKETYYSNMLQLLETNVASQERIATAIEAIASSMNQG